MAADTAEQADGILRAAEEAERIAGTLPRPHGVMLFGRGTSEHAALYAKYLLETVAAIPATIAAPSTATIYGAELALDGWLAAGISQSGETREIVDCLHWARSCGAQTLAVTNASTSPLASAADVTLALGVGPERAVAATKTFTAECAALAALAGSWAGQPLAWPELAAAVADALDAPVDLALAEALSTAELAVVLGRGLYVPIAMEVALKIMEGCGIWATGGSWADLLHGPIAALPREAMALVLRSGMAGSASNAQLEQRLADSGIQAWSLRAAEEPRHAALGPLLPIVAVVHAQCLVLEVARRRGRDPDRPAGLTKVTQT
jgi:glucosamine--fructose-6-phosphate aminotransferase (isomerizing)